MLRRSAFLGACAVLLATLLPGIVSAAPGTVLPFSEFGDMVVDQAHEHVFVSERTGLSDLAVLDLQGNPVTTIAGVSAMRMVLEGNTLYVAMGFDSIHRIDTESLQDTGEFGIDPLNTGVLRSVRDVAISGNRLWFAYGNCDSYPRDGGVASMDLVAGVVRTYEPGTFPTTCPMITTGPPGTNVLLAWNRSESPPTLQSYRTLDPPQLLSGRTLTELTAPITDVAVTPDGSALQVASNGTDALVGFTTSDLEPSGVNYETKRAPVAVDITGTGWIAAGEASSGPTDPLVDVYPVGTTTPMAALPLFQDWVTDTIVPGAIAFSGDAGALFVVVQRGRTLVLRVVDRPVAGASSLTLSAESKTSTIGEPATFSGFLDLAAPGDPGGATIHVFRRSAVEPEVQLPDVQADDTGTFSFQDSPSDGTWVYRVTWDGSDDFRGAEARLEHVVEKIDTSITIKASKTFVNYKHPLTLAVHLAGLQQVDGIRSISLYRSPTGTDDHYLVAEKKVDDRGNASFLLYPKAKAEYVVTYEGDGFHQASGASLWIRVGSIMVVHFRGGYAQAGKYRLFRDMAHGCYRGHRDGCPTLDMWIIPNQPGDLVSFGVQVRSTGHWRWLGITRFALPQGSRASIAMFGARADRDYRFGACFLGSLTNEGVCTPWYYFRVTG
ncbi:MAG: hypothetical protein ABR600_00780 [Actinomycetota bacterium]